MRNFSKGLCHFKDTQNEGLEREMGTLPYGYLRAMCSMFHFILLRVGSSLMRGFKTICLVEVKWRCVSGFSLSECLGQYPLSNAKSNQDLYIEKVCFSLRTLIFIKEKMQNFKTFVDTFQKDSKYRAPLGFIKVMCLLLSLSTCSQASTNTWQGGTGTLTNNVTNPSQATTQILTNGGSTWKDTGSVTRAARTEIRNSNTNTAPGQRLELEVHNEISVLGIYETNRGQANIVNKLEVKNGGKIQCGTFCNDGNGLYIGNNRTAQLINLRLENGATINAPNRGRVNVNGGYLGVVFLASGARIQGEGIRLNNGGGISTVNNSGSISSLSCGTSACGSIEEVDNKAGGTITTIAGSANHNLNITKSLTNAGTITTINKANITQTLSNSGRITTIQNSAIQTFNVNGGNINNVTNNTIGSMTISGGTVSNITNNTINGTLTVSGGNVTNITNNNINNIAVSGGTVGSITNTNPTQTLNSLTVSGGTVSNIDNIVISNLTNNANITTIGADAKITTLNNSNGTISNFTLNDNVEFNSAGYHLNGTITTLTIQKFNIELQSPEGTWNAHTITNRGQHNEHLYISGTVNTLNINPGAIVISAGQNVGQGIYKYDKVILNGATKTTNFSHLSPAQGLKLYDYSTGFSLNANAATSFGAAALQSIDLNDTRRMVIIENIMDAINIHHFYRISVKRKGKDNKVADSKSQEIDTSKWQKSRGFVVPYGTYGNLGVTGNFSDSYIGGLITGIHRDFSTKGIASAYVGYEYNATKSALTTASANMDSNILQAGLAHIKTFARFSNAQLYAKSNLRGNFTFFNLNATEGGRNFKADTYTYSAGLALRGGAAIYLGDKSYISLEAGFSYDLLSVLAFEIIKAPLANEIYPTHTVHLPQPIANVKFYRAVGQFWRYSVSLGGRYNILNRPTLSFEVGPFSDSAKIILPSYYANVNVDISRAISRISELGIGVTSLVYEGGSSHSLSVKYVKWF